MAQVKPRQVPVAPVEPHMEHPIPRLHLKFCRLIKRAMYVCTGFPQLEPKSAHLLEEVFERAKCEQADGPTKSSQAGGRQLEFCPASDSLADWYKHELDDYAHSVPARTGRTRRAPARSVLLFVALNVLVVAKYWYHILLTVSELDHRDFENNIKQIGGPESQHKFACVLTNCTQLLVQAEESERATAEEEPAASGRHLAPGLALLPIFSLCHPNLQFLYSPLADLGPFGLLADCYTSLFVCCVSVTFPLQQMLTQANDESLMFIVAPHVTVDLLYAQLGRMQREFASSLENFCAFLRAESATTERRGCYSATSCYRHPVAPPHDFAQRHWWGRATRATKTDHLRRQLEAGGSSPRARKSGQSAAQDERRTFFSECLPAVRTAWWRQRVAYLYFNSFFWFCLVMTLPVASLCLAIVHSQLEGHKERLVALDELMARQQCAIWHEETARTTLRVRELEVGWSLWDVVETTPPFVCATYLIIILSVLVFVIVCELACWLREVRQNLQLLIELARVRPYAAYLQHEVARLRSLPTTVGSSSAEQRNLGNSRASAAMRHLFTSHTHTWFFFLITQPLRVTAADLGALDHSPPNLNLNLNLNLAPELQARIARQQFALKMLAGHHSAATTSSDLLAELTKKLYLNHRLFVRLISSSSTNIAAIVLLEQMGAYGATLTAVFLARFARGVGLYANLLICVALTSVFTFTGLISNFHAEARKLQPLFWSLIAELTHARDLELRHLRHVLVKQTIHIDREGGLAMSAFNFRVTYTNVIQVIAWTSTILVLALRP